MQKRHFTIAEGVLSKIMILLVEKSQIQVSPYLEVHKWKIAEAVFPGGFEYEYSMHIFIFLNIFYLPAIS